VEIRLLGPVEVVVDGQTLTLRRRQERCLLAILALEEGRLVPMERLVDLLWPENPPPAARATVHALVSRLRATLRPADPHGVRLVSRGTGYALETGPGVVDVHRFRSLVERARSAATRQERADRLRSALDLWRGLPLADAADDDDRARLCPDLEELRLAAQEEWLETALELGEHRGMIGPLVQQVAEHPLRERPVALLMLALYRSGRKSDALATYADLVQRLRDELGLDPDPSVQELHTAILRDELGLAAGAPVGAGDDSDTVRPAQLPARAGHFVGREDHLRELDRLLELDLAPTAVIITAISGTAGVGKTALAVQWSHRVRDRFPDGQLFLDLRGYSTSAPMRPIEALGQCLRALGVPAPEVPVDLDEASAMFRTHLADRRVLVVLDNAHRAEQVRPLLPGNPRCLVVVTSRDALGGLVAKEGARRLSLDVLPADEAIALLASVIGADRVEREAEATHRLARACACLPLALRIAAARLLDEPGRSIDSYVGQLTQGRLDELEVAGDDEAAVRAAFDLSYAKLDPDGQRMFRLVGLVPGPDVTLDAARAMFGDAPARAEPAKAEPAKAEPAKGVARHLARLVSAHLLSEVRPGRYSCHDLLRVYATEESEGQGEANEGRQRLFGWYLHRTDAAATVLYPQMARLPVGEVPPGLPPLLFTDDTEAMAWLEDERANLLAAVEHCTERGPYRFGWALGDAMRGYFWMRRYAAEWRGLADNGLAAARADGHAGGEAAAELSLANLDWSQGRLREAVEHYERALPLTRAAGWKVGEAAALNNIGSIYIDLGPLSQALDWLNAAVAIDREMDWPDGLAMHLSNIGVVYAQLGQLAEAVERFEEALAIYRKSASRGGLAQGLNHIGLVHGDMGELELGLAELTEAVSLYRELGNRHGEAFGLSGLTDIFCLLGRYAEAEESATAMYALAREIGDQRAEATALDCLGTVDYCFGRYREAVQHHRQSYEVALGVGDVQADVESNAGVARALIRLGEVSEALEIGVAALDRCRRAGFRVVEGQLHNVLADAYLARGDWAAAADHAEQAAAIHRETGARAQLVEALLQLGQAAAGAGDDAAARRHWRVGREIAGDLATAEALQLRALT